MLPGPDAQCARGGGESLRRRHGPRLLVFRVGEIGEQVGEQRTRDVLVCICGLPGLGRVRPVLGDRQVRRDIHHHQIRIIEMGLQPDDVDDCGP